MANKHVLRINAGHHGEFTRTTASNYTHAVVRTSKRAMKAHVDTLNGDTRMHGGVTGRWHKDRGYAVTWHGSARAAVEAASKPYMWDRHTSVVGIFAVES